MHTVLSGLLCFKVHVLLDFNITWLSKVMLFLNQLRKHL